MGVCQQPSRKLAQNLSKLCRSYLVGVGTKAKVLDGLTGVLGAAEEEGVGAGGGTEGQLVEGQALAAGSSDAGAGGGGEAQSGDGQLGDLEQAVVVGDGADNDDGLALVGLARVLVGSRCDDAGDGHGRAVDARHEQTAEDHLVEVRIRAACLCGQNWPWARVGFAVGAFEATYGQGNGTASPGA